MAVHRRAVFIDRDDTLCKDVHYCRRPEDLKLLPGAGEAVSRLNKAGFLVVVITNQSGIARGIITEEDLHRIHEKMKKDLVLHGAHVDRIYYCPHHPDDGCACRKPGTLLIERAVEDLDIQLEDSYMVGDRLFDMEMARRTGTTAVLVLPPERLGETEEAEAISSYVAPDLEEAVGWILSQEGK